MLYTKKDTFMNKKRIVSTVILFFSLLATGTFSSCDKDTNCYLDVYVIDEATTEPISGAAIAISQPNGGTVTDNGVTGPDGHYKTHFKSPAIIQIKATYQVPPAQGGGQRRGDVSVRLLEGETKIAKISLTSQIYFD